MRFTRLEKFVFIYFVLFRLTLLAINLGVFEKIGTIGVIFSVLNSGLVYLCLVPLIIVSTKRWPISAHRTQSLLPLHIVLAFIYAMLFELLSYLLIYFFAANSSEIIELVFATVHWKMVDNMSSYLVVVLILYALQYSQLLSKEKLLQLELKEQLKNAELEALKYQLNPHFLFNSLNSINALILEKSDRAQQMLIGLSDFLRFSLSVRNTRLIPLETELEQIERYLAIEKIRFNERLIIELSNTCPKTAAIPTLLLQPLIENAIKHSVAKSVTVCTIAIECRLENNQIYIRIQNDLPENSTSDGLGVGLSNVENRLRVNFQDAYTFSVLAKNHFQVNLSFPFVEVD